MLSVIGGVQRAVENVIVPIMVAVVPACLAAWAALKASQVHREVKSPNGTRTGAQVYSLKTNVEELKDDVRALEDKVSTIEERQLDIRERQINHQERSSQELNRNMDRIMKRMDDHDEHDTDRFNKVFKSLGAETEGDEKEI